MTQGQRRLAAIMFTDLVGYTLLGQRNEELSLALVDEHRKLVRPILQRHAGREVKTIGDAFLVEFSNALDAVRCAYDIQRAVREFNFSLPAARAIHLRIGIHLGDVVESAGDIAGDAVNVASRIESLAEDGGVCLTRQLHDQVHNKFELPFESLGPKQLKNVSTNVEVYKMVMPWEKAESTPVARLLKTRVAILPFANFSPDPNDTYFADGITEEIISTASGVSGLSVISRTSVMGYKGSTKKVKEIGRELDAGSILEGSFRKAGDKIRVTAQLIDVDSDTHVWAQNYDRMFRDIFDVQTDIANSIANALKVKILPGERERIERPPTESVEAYALYLKGRHYWNERTEASMRTAIKYFEKALERDHRFALAYAGIADCYLVLVGHGYMKRSEGHPKAMESLTAAIGFNESLGEAHAALGSLLQGEWKWTEAEREFKRALQLSPSYATGHHWYSQSLASQGKIEEAIAEIEKAHQLDPNSLQILSTLGIWTFYAGDVDKAIEIQERVLAIDPDFLPGLANIFYPFVSKNMLTEAKGIIESYLRLVGMPPNLLGPYANV
ncbi:MAG TPA: adenylate/guanylate cyclase domain-containing protein, partial [Nitrososphaerales archaeon]